MDSAVSLRLGGGPLPVVGRARIYVCGITPYDTTHLGHAAVFVWTDLAARVLRSAGVRVELCRNVTDVDDALTAVAARAGEMYDRFAAVQKFHFDRDAAVLGVSPPAHEPRAHNHVGDVIALAAALLESGHGYQRAGSVYFRGAGVAEAAAVDRDEALRLAVEFGDHPDDPAKDDPLDVAVWRRSDQDEPVWPSPWGPGRPGWHAECAAMALTVLGPGIDLLAGGADLRFPHHAYQAAMAHAATGVAPFARRRMQVGVVCVDGMKMAKSTGNLVLVSDLVADRQSGRAVRLMLLSRRWHEPWDYEPAALEAASARLDRLYAAAARRESDSGSGEAAVHAALRDDLNVPAALDVAEESGGAAARAALRVLGLS